jgi:hypothetical protein
MSYEKGRYRQCTQCGRYTLNVTADHCTRCGHDFQFDDEIRRRVEKKVRQMERSPKAILMRLPIALLSVLFDPLGTILGNDYTWPILGVLSLSGIGSGLAGFLVHRVTSALGMNAVVSSLMMLVVIGFGIYFGTRWGWRLGKWWKQWTIVLFLPAGVFGCVFMVSYFRLAIRTIRMGHWPS